MLKITASTNLVLKTLRVDDDEVVEISGRANKTFRNLSKSKKSKNKKSKVQTRIWALGNLFSQTPAIKKPFTV